MKFRHFNHERLIIVAIWVGLIGTLSTLGWELPVQSVVNPTCDKSAHWDDLDDSCKLELYKNGQVTDQAESFSSLIFSALWGASYSDPHAKDVGGHPSLDIVSVSGTPVYAIGSGKVTKASLRNGYGQAITIKHTLENGETVYSNYSHLNDMHVSKGDSVKEGDIIGTVGRTGFTIGKRGNHLDFQITTADSPSHPYGYHDCATPYYDAVETRACEDKLKKYTIDPVVFFLKHGNYDLTPLTGIANKSEIVQEHAIAPEEQEEIITEEEVKDNEVVEDLLEKGIIIEKPSKDITVVSDNKISTLLRAIVSNRVNINKSVFIPLERQYNQFSKDNGVKVLAGSVQPEKDIPANNNIPYTITRELPVIEGSNNVGKVMPLHFTIKDKFGVAYNGSLEEKVHIEYNDTHISISPSRFGRVVGGTKNLFLTAKKDVNTTITIKYGDIILGTEVLFYGNN